MKIKHIQTTRGQIVLNTELTNKQAALSNLEVWTKLPEYLAKEFKTHKGLLNFSSYVGYPVFFITENCEANCPDCVTEAIKCGTFKERSYIAQEANWENRSLYCDDCGERIPSAYADDEEPSDWSEDE